jgi:hypothetical protein
MIYGQQSRCFIITDVFLVDDRARSEQVEMLMRNSDLVNARCIFHGIDLTLFIQFNYCLDLV